MNNWFLKCIWYALAHIVLEWGCKTSVFCHHIFCIIADTKLRNWWMVAVVQDRKMLRPVLPNRDTKVDWRWRDGPVLLPKLLRNMPTLKYVCNTFFTRHSLVERRMFVCSVNDFSTTRGPIQAKVRMQAYSGSGCVFSPFGGWRPPAGGKRGKWNFPLLWESVGNFYILAVFERYLSNACTDLHQILFV